MSGGTMDVDPTDRIIQIQGVGNDDEEVRIHESLLRASTKFFNGQINASKWNHRRISFCIETSFAHETLLIYSKWLYNKKLDFERESDENEVRDLAAAYDMAVKLDAVEFTDACVDQLISMLGGKISFTMDFLISTIVDYFPPGSHARRVVVHWLIRSDFSHCTFYDYDGTREIVKKFADDDLLKLLASEFMGVKMDNLFSLFVKESPVVNYIDNPCHYHRHTELGQPCYKASRAREKSAAGSRDPAQGWSKRDEFLTLHRNCSDETHSGL